jgi:hypothetical protein
LFCLPNQGQQQPSTDLSNVNLSSSKSFSQSYPSSLSFNSDNNNNINSSSSSSINGVNNSISSSSNSSSSSSISSTATISGNNQNDEIFESLSKKIDNYTNSLKKDQINNENNYSIQSHLSQDSISSPQISTNNNNNNNNTKQKIKPNPLVIPSAISAFQQQNHAANILQVSQAAAAAAAVAVTNPQFSSFQQQLSNTYAIYAAAAAMAHHMGPPYPNATLLKSPRLFNNYDFNSPEYNFNLKKQYTPPPMLSPFRKGPGLFCNSKQFANYLPQTLFSFQSQQHHHHHVFKPTPQYSHSLSENHLGSNYTLNNTYQNNINNNNIKLGTSFDPNFSKMNNNNNNNNNNDNKHSHSDDDSNDEDTSINVKKIVDKTIESETNFIQIDDSDSNNSNDSVVISNSNKPALLNSSSYLSTKSSLKRPRLCKKINFFSFHPPFVS